MTKRSATCFGKQSEKPLVEYASQAKAVKAAEYVSRRYNTPTRFYKCNTCGAWHLSSSQQRQPQRPTNENKRNDGDNSSLSWRSKKTHDFYRSQKSSTCVGRVSQQPLTEYPSKIAAENGADMVFQKFGDTTTEAYKCRHCKFWHVASKKEQHSMNTCYEHGRGILMERSQKSAVCFGKHDGAPLTEYRSLDDLFSSGSARQHTIWEQPSPLPLYARV